MMSHSNCKFAEVSFARLFEHRTLCIQEFEFCVNRLLGIQKLGGNTPLLEEPACFPYKQTTFYPPVSVGGNVICTGWS